MLGIEGELYLRFGLCVCRGILPAPNSSAGRLNKHRVAPDRDDRIDATLGRDDDLQTNHAPDMGLAQCHRVSRILFVDQLASRVSLGKPGGDQHKQYRQAKADEHPMPAQAAP